MVFGQPIIKEEEIDEVVDSLQSGWIGTGPKVFQFEEAFKKYRNASFAIGVNSCTAALHLSLLASGLGAGASRDTFHQIKLFIFKLVILCVIVGITFVTSGVFIANKINQVSSEISFTDILKKQIGSIVNQLEGVSEDKKQERLKKIRLIIRELRPIVQEFQTLLALPVQDEANSNEVKK